MKSPVCTTWNIVHGERHEPQCYYLHKVSVALRPQKVGVGCGNAMTSQEKLSTCAAVPRPYFCSTFYLVIFTFPLLPPRNSEKTDVDSTHSSNLSNFPEKIAANAGGGGAVIPPDALYATSEKQGGSNRANNMIIASKYYSSSSNDAMFNDSKVRTAAVAEAEESFV